jgi:3-deoxy-D-manno-octulosonic-acid transferase
MLNDNNLHEEYAKLQTPIIPRHAEKSKGFKQTFKVIALNHVFTKVRAFFPLYDSLNP